ncbi:MAG TPA: indolepyruvate oxidoreductase subunit beta family protein [Steroidobacteraceae bacterium]|nr:indolepyruvate oxidoreductase subunit beta family protein [Steroidobacteraceae bacterium]
MSERTVKLTIAALGGQGGHVLSKWLIEIAERNACLVQATSVPGVAQRTGSTLYYLELLARAAAESRGREPVMALMPVAGDVDCVVAAELAEAARAIARGLVTEQTTLIASTHRAYAIAEKSALGRGITDPQQLLELVRSHGKRAVVFDMEETAERNRSHISAVLLGAICGAGVLPFSKESCAEAISRSGLAVTANLAAFEDGWRQARSETSDASGAARGGKSALPPVPQSARTPALQPLLDRVRELPASLQPLILEGVRRTLDYQDPAYARLYLERVERVAALDARTRGGAEAALTEALARGLALWMTFEDTIRVADLKTRSARFERVRREARAAPGQLFGLTEFVRPRVAEIAATLPAGVGSRLLRSPRIRGWLGRWTDGRKIRTRTVRGFLLLYALAGLRRWRRGTWRFREENARIGSWLATIERLAVTRYDLAVELARAQRLIKGYGDTHERGWRNFSALVAQLERLAARADGAILLSRLQEAALADEEGAALGRELAALDAGASAAPAAGEPRAVQPA